MGRVLVGTCNWSLHRDFYPPGMKSTDQIGYYARIFPVVEVDSTFYQLMRPESVMRWSEKTGENFVFDVKAFRSLTRHQSAEPSDADRFDASIQPLRESGKLGAILFQFPPWFGLSEINRAYLAGCRERFRDDLVAVELRHRSWFRDDAETARTLHLLRGLSLVHVAVDEPQVGDGSVPAVPAVTHARLGIVRMHGRNNRQWLRKVSAEERFDYRYSLGELAEWVPLIDRMAGETDELHVLLNNSRHSVTAALEMTALLGQAAPELEKPPAQLALPLS